MTKYQIILLLIFFFAFAVPQEAKATTYYVSANGNDNNFGYTESLAWKTLDKVNAAQLFPGDSVLFMRGHVFAGQLRPAISGTDSAWIIYGAYGSGDRPIIDGSAYNALYIDNPNIHHLRYENIDFSGATQSATALIYTHDMYFYNDIFRGSTVASGFVAGWGVGEESYNITLDTCEFANNFKNGALIGSNTGVNGPHDVIIKNSYAHHNGTDMYAHHGFYIKFGVTIQDSVAAYNKSAGFKVNCESVFDSPYAPILSNNTSYGNSVGIYVGHNKAKIFGNYAYANTYSNISMDGDADDNQIFSNTFENVTNVSGNSNFSFQGGNLNAGNVITNNLFIQNRSISPRYMFMSARGTLAEFVTNNLIDNNTYYSDGNSTTKIFIDTVGLYSWNEYRAMVGSPDTNGKFLIDLPASSPTPSLIPSPSSFATADINGSGQVDSLDLLLVLRNWLNAGVCDTYNCDLNNDSKINAWDAVLVISNIGL